MPSSGPSPATNVSGQRAGEHWQLYTVSAQGGSPQAVPEAVDAMGVTWSPDGRSIIFGNSGGIRTVDLRTRIVSTIAGSDGLSSPRLSPDGLNMVAISNDAHRLMLFNFKTKIWAGYARMENLGWLNWSADGNYVYFVGATNDDAGIVRMAVRGGKSEKIVSLKSFRSTGVGGGWFSLGPADELLLLKNTGGGTEIYALSWDAQ